jgi:hypothetical protein
LKTLAHDPRAVVVYDNLNFKDVKRDEVVGHTAEMRSVTTAAVVYCPDIPPTGLQQSMHDPTIPLRVDDIFNSPGISGSEHAPTITRALISDAIKKIHTSGVIKVFMGSDQYPKMPNIDRIKPEKTEFWQLAAIHENEGTIKGTYGVHTDIFIKQLGLCAPDNADSPSEDTFRDRLFLVHGDQLTAHHIRSVKFEQAQATRPFDRRDWLLGIPAWFHIQMNLLYTIIRTHWEPLKYGLDAHHTLKADITTWGRSSVSRDNAKYHQIEPLVAQSFTSRVAALFYAAMRRRRYLTEALSMDEITDMVGQLSPSQFIELVDDVRQNAFTLEAWNGTGPLKHDDIEYRTMCRMLQEIELFLTVRFAVKVGDIGLLRYVVDPLIIVFFGAAQYNYGREMLFYRWNLTQVNTPELQRAILSSGLVNWPGNSTTFKPIDLGLEHLNGSTKIEMNCYRNSTHDFDLILSRVSLSNNKIRQLRAKLEDAFGNTMSDAHTTAKVVQEMFLVASNVFIGDLAEPRDDIQLRSFPHLFDSHDIKEGGMAIIEKQIKQFNHVHVRQASRVIRSSELLDSNEDDVFIDIDDLGEDAPACDGLIDPTIDITEITMLDPNDGY